MDLLPLVHAGEFDPVHGYRISSGFVAPDIRLHTLVGEFRHDLRSALDTRS